MENVEWWQALIIIVVLFSFFGIGGFFIYLSSKKQEEWINKRVYHVSIHIDNLDGEEDEQSEN